MFACFHSLINNASKFPGASKREKRGKNWSFSFMQTALNNVLAGLALFCQTSPAMFGKTTSVLQAHCCLNSIKIAPFSESFLRCVFVRVRTKKCSPDEWMMSGGVSFAIYPI
jgi:hypothetical protein